MKIAIAPSMPALRRCTRSLHAAPRSRSANSIAISRSDEKLKRALELGADRAINRRFQDVVASVMTTHDGQGVEVAIETVGADVWPIALKSLVRGGRIVTCGATSCVQPSAELRCGIVQIHE